jgi:hypothetical protein
MKKTLIVLVVACAAVYLGLDLFLGSVVRAGVNGFGPRLTGTKVELGSASISPLTGSGTLRNLVVGNPTGWSDQNAFSLGRVHIKVEPFSIFRDHIVIDEIIVDGPEFNYETKVVSSNIKDLLKNIDAFSANSDAGKTPTAKNGQPIKFVVMKFRMTNATARLGGLPIPLPPISMDGLGVSEGGITPDQLAGAMMKNVLAGIVTGSADALGKVGATAGANAAEQATDTFKKLFGGAAKP